ncbi:MAG: OmpA family protein [Myxococcaceae bacterium]
MTLRCTHILPYALRFPRIHPPLLLAGLGLLLGATAGAQGKEDDFNPFPTASTPTPQGPAAEAGQAAPKAPPALPATAPPAPAAAPVDTLSPPPLPPTAVDAPAGPTAAASGPPAGVSPAVGAVPGETVVQLLPGSPPPGPSTLGDGWLDARNTRLSQGLFGGLGTLNVSSADIGGQGVLRFAAFGQYYSNSGWPRASDEATRTAGRFALDFVVLPWLELYASYAASSTNNTGSNPNFLSAVGDVGLGAKFSWRLSGAFALALDVRASRLPGVGSQDLDQAGYTLAPYLLFAWTPRLPLRFGFQFGAQWQWNSVVLSQPGGGAEDDIALDRTTYNQLLAGLSLEFPLPIVTPFFEYTTGYPLNVRNGTLVGANGQSVPIHSALPHQMNVGLKFSLIENLTLLVAGQFGLQGSVALGVPAIPPWNFVFAATYAVDLFPQPATRVVVHTVAAPPGPPTTGAVVGRVVDAATQLPLGGVVVSVEGSPASPVATDAAAGQFLTRPLPPGPIQLRLQKEGYQEALLDAVVEAGVDTQLLAALTPRPQASHLLLRTTAQRHAVAARVKLSGAETKVVDTQADAAGPLVVDVAPGAYLAEVTAEGYLAQLREVEVSAGAELQLAFELQREPKRRRVVLRDDRLELLVQVHFAPGRATILADSYPLLDEVVDAVVRLGIKRVRVEGYSDSSGTRAANLRLSQARAEAVTDYLQEKGLAANRLEAKGYGDARPIAPNLTARGRELNRRVEIVVLEK